MSYNPNSLESQKGALGEQIVKKQLEAEGCEVKVQAAYPYGVGNAPCYSFF